MNRIYILIFSLVFLACGGGDGDDIKVIQENENHGNNEEEIIEEEVFSVTIDETDLVNLPTDNGGSHIAIKKENTDAAYGYYIYKPEGYVNDGPAYPLLIFLHGWSPNLGKEPLESILVHGPPRLIETNKWDPIFPFLVVSPQLTGSSYWPPYKMHSFIEYLMEKYQVNKDRIYLTGLSLGGGGCWYYAGEYADNYLAAIVPISASGAPSLIDNLTKIPIWAFHGGQDSTVKAYENYGSVPLVEAINLNSPKVRARITVYESSGHDAWGITYSGAGKNYASKKYDSFNMDLYEWMLAYKKSDQD